MKILINDYSGHPFSFELSQLLSKKYNVIHAYAEYFETPKANFKSKKKNSNLKIVPIKVEKKFQKDNFILRRSIDILYGKKIIDLIINKKPNIIVCAQIPLDPLLKIMTFCKKNNIKIIFWMQDIYSVAISKILNKKFPLIGKLIGKYYFRVEKKCENMSDKIIVISSNFKKFLEKESLKKTTVVENWSPIIKPNNIKVKYYKKKFNPNNKFCFIYSGTLGYKHNTDLFISIAMKFPKAIQIISSKGKFANALKKKAIRESLNIKVINWINYNELSSFLSIADALIVTLENDASAFSVPSKIYNYLTIRKPILASMPADNLGSKKIKKMQVGYVSKPENINAFLNHSRLIIQSKRLRVKLSNNSKKYLKTKQSSIHKMIKIIEQLKMKDLT